MRYRTCLSIIIIILSFGIISRCNSVVYAADFLKLYDNESGSMYLDLSSIEDHGEYIIACTKHMLVGEELNNLKKNFGQKLAYGTISVALKKDERKMQRLGGGFYDSEGVPLYTQKKEEYSKDKLVEIKNGTVFYVVWDIVMRQSME